MSRPNSALYFAFLVAVWALLGGVALAKGGFYLAKHEGDTLHLLQIVFRMADGEWPHLDFMTPIGVLAFAPIALFVKLGYGVGNAILLSQILVAGMLLPAVFWAGWTRLQGLAAYLFGGVVLVLALALIHGETEGSVSISMHYNRWAWALSYVVIVLTVLPPRVNGNQIVDGAIIGLGMAALALCKITYFASFAFPVLVILLMRGALRSLVVAVLAGIALVALITVLAGAEFWPAYFNDLMAVLRSERSAPGLSYREIMSAPPYLFGSLTLLASVILLRQAGSRIAGLGLMLLIPGFFYVTYQNFGNDPQWLMLLAVFLWAERPDEGARNALGWNLPRAFDLAAMATIALAAPSFLNLAYSPFRHLSLKEEKYAPMLAARPQHHDLLGLKIRLNAVDGRIALDGPGSGLEGRVEAAKREETRTIFQGEELPNCGIASGLVAWFETIVNDLETHGYGADTRLFAADLFSSHWLVGDLPRLKYGTPWYYGGLGGFEDAEYLLVPLCPSGQTIRKKILEAVAAQPVALTEIRRTPLYILYRISRG